MPSHNLWTATIIFLAALGATGCVHVEPETHQAEQINASGVNNFLGADYAISTPTDRAAASASLLTAEATETADFLPATGQRVEEPLPREIRTSAPLGPNRPIPTNIFPIFRLPPIGLSGPLAWTN